MNKKELPNTWKPDLKPKTELEEKKLKIQKEIMHLENKKRFVRTLKQLANLEDKLYLKNKELDVLQ